MKEIKDKQNKSNIQYTPIYNLRLAGFLMMNGIPIKRVEVNLGRPWRDVYLFEKSEKIEELISEYKMQKSKGEFDYGSNLSASSEDENY